MVIYKITNKINGLMYVGQTRQTLAKRWNFHVMAKRNVSRRISNAIQKYGPRSFTIEIVATAQNQQELNRLEQYYIATLQTLSPEGYNLTSGGESPVMSAETRIKMSLAKRGRPSNHKGWPAWNKGMRFESSAAAKAVKCLETGVVYQSATAAAKALGLNLSKISNVCTGLRKSTGGLTFAHLGGA